MSIARIRAQSVNPVSLDEVGPDFFVEQGDTEPCPECGGTGFVYRCEQDWACVYPEGGCDMCEFPCEHCGACL